jgi:zinc protease
LAALRDTPVDENELQKAKNLEQAQFVFGQDSIFREAMMLGTYEMLGDYRMVDKYLDGIDKVTSADVQRVAKKYLVATNMTAGVLIPTGILPHEGGGGLSGGQVRHTDAMPAFEAIR